MTSRIWKQRFGLFLSVPSQGSICEGIPRLPEWRAEWKLYPIPFSQLNILNVCCFTFRSVRGRGRWIFHGWVSSGSLHSQNARQPVEENYFHLVWQFYGEFFCFGKRNSWRIQIKRVCKKKNETWAVFSWWFENRKARSLFLVKYGEQRVPFQRSTGKLICEEAFFVDDIATKAFRESFFGEAF